MKKSQTSIEDSSFENIKSHLSCNLENSELEQRGNLLQSITDRKLKASVTEKAYSLDFDHDRAIITDLIDFILKEQRCCPILTFSLEFDKQQEIITLMIYSDNFNPNDIQTMFETLIKGK